MCGGLWPDAIDCEHPLAVVDGNSVVLHELYFENLGGDGEPAGDIARDLGTAFRDRAGFEERFRATAKSLVLISTSSKSP